MNIAVEKYLQISELFRPSLFKQLLYLHLDRELPLFKNFELWQMELLAFLGSGREKKKKTNLYTKNSLNSVEKQGSFFYYFLNLKQHKNFKQWFSNLIGMEMEWQGLYS